MAAFTGFRQPVELKLLPNVTEKQLEAWPPFRKWKETLQFSLELQYTDPHHDFRDDPYLLKSITLQSADWFGHRIGFVKLRAVTRNSKGALPGIVLLRGGSVAIFMVLRPKDSRDERWVVMIQQPRIPVGSLKLLEIPAGMIDETDNFAGAAAKEILEKTGFSLPISELTNLTDVAVQRSLMSETSLMNAVYPSPGGSDEFVAIFLWEKVCLSGYTPLLGHELTYRQELDRQEIEDLRGKLIGDERQGELITLRVVSYDDVWREGARDAKTLAAWAL